MAIIYTPQSSSPALDPLVARIYADGIDIHEARLQTVGLVTEFIPPHELRGCTTFQWQFDHERDGTWVDIPSATFDTYQVDESDVANSGDYRCCIRIGGGDDCIRYTEIRTIAIIDCQDTSLIKFLGEGGDGSRSISIRFPHFLRNSVTVTSPAWVDHEDIICAEVSGVCAEISNLSAVSVLRETTASTVDDRDSTARNGYVDIMIGSFLCSYTVQQDFIRDEAAPEDIPVPAEPEPEDIAPPIGPTVEIINLNSTVPVGSIALVSALAYVLLEDGSIDATVMESDISWSVTRDGTAVTDLPDPFYNNGTSTQLTGFDTAFAGNKEIVFTATINGVSVSATAFLTVSQDTSGTEDGVVSGELSGRGIARTIALGANDAPWLDQSKNKASGSFVVEQGLASITFQAFDRAGSLIGNRAYDGNAELEFSISGPGIINGNFSATVSLPAGEESIGSFLDPGYVYPVNNTFSAGGALATFNNAGSSTPPVVDGELRFTEREDGFLTPGNYSVAISVTSAGIQPNPKTFFFNTYFSPSITWSVTPKFNFGFNFDF